MPYITLVRHGQANTTARDEASYDHLSDLGTQQATWLGQYLTDTGEHFPRAYRGSLHRHLETADAMGFADARIDPRLNEMAFFTLAHLFEDQHGVVIPDSREDFALHLPRMIAAWQAGDISDAPESFAQFEARVTDGLNDIGAGEGRAVVVTSGGVIGMALRITMGLDVTAMARVCLAVENTSLSRWLPLHGALALTQFNALPHLDLPDRQFARTHL
jgi:broad specificity phosphatase PhoE